MKKRELIDFFNGQPNAAEALGITPQAISIWGDDVPSRKLGHVEAVMELERQRREKEQDPDGTNKYPPKYRSGHPRHRRA